jgi:hypothetical protein
MTEHGQLLSLQQLSFVNSLFLPQVLLDPQKAAKVAAYKSPKSAAERLMKNPAVRAEVEKRMARLSLASGLSAESVLGKLWDESNNHDEGDSNPAARVSALRTLAQYFELIGQKNSGSGGEKPAPVININIGVAPVKETSGPDNAKVIDVKLN